jgi:hypothetical protein
MNQTQVAPLVFLDSTFALKGVTAIKLFICDITRRGEAPSFEHHREVEALADKAAVP